MIRWGPGAPLPSSIDYSRPTRRTTAATSPAEDQSQHVVPRRWSLGQQGAFASPMHHPLSSPDVKHPNIDLENWPLSAHFMGENTECAAVHPGPFGMASRAFPATQRRRHNERRVARGAGLPSPPLSTKATTLCPARTLSASSHDATALDFNKDVLHRRSAYAHAANPVPGNAIRGLELNIRLPWMRSSRAASGSVGAG